MTIRKNFVLDEKVAKHLEELAKERKMTQTAVITNLIEEQMRERLIDEKLNALEQFAGSMELGNYNDRPQAVQAIKADMDV